jgi:replicative DNA helicase
MTCKDEGMSDELVTLSAVLADADALLHEGRSAAPRVWPTGFPVLDTYLGGGVRAGELTLIGGPQGLGKTTFALQVLRNIAAGGGHAVYFSYEHDAPTVLERLLACEAGERGGLEAVPMRRIREVFQAGDGGRDGLAARLAAVPGGAGAVESLSTYADRLMIHRANGALTDLEVIRQTAMRTRDALGDHPAIVVDYLQKVAIRDSHDVEEERVTRIVEGLKDLALEIGIPVIAIVAADKEGLVSGKRLRVNHLRGSSALAYEADVVLILNDKFDVVARHHLVYDVSNAERYREWVVITIEKNRGGLDRIDLEFRKRFEHSRFDPEGQVVNEQLVDERVYVE